MLGPGALCVAARRCLCRGTPLLPCIGARRCFFALGPSAVCVRSEDSLYSVTAIWVSGPFVGARGPLPALFASGHGTGNPFPRLYFLDIGGLWVGWGAFCWSVDIQGSVRRGPALFVSGPGALFVGARHVARRALCRVTTLPRRSFNRAPALSVRVYLEPGVFIKF